MTKLGYNHHIMKHPLEAKRLFRNSINYFAIISAKFSFLPKAVYDAGQFFC
ncbi:hypothetical protein HNQ92_002336 [Rhabdobacter roseus]|uniref:Uncharacterized protein n=1 Tax=Rhabdobacter roseus TaxID=1655419 RepID=A0A840TSE9_9BACT|nr:hypothetical protein [Rhabdobacter roseus]